MFGWSVEHHPDGEIVRYIFEAVRDVGGREQQVAGADVGDCFFHAITRGARGDDVELIAQMWDLRAVGWSRGEADFHVAVDEYFG